MNSIEEIPSRFKIANTEITVKIVDHTYNNNYGNWEDVMSTITVAHKIKIDDEYIELTDEQMLNTFYHELFHAFNWFWNNKCDEALAQSFANFMREYEATKK